MGYITPADVTVSDTFQGHKNRNSNEPGTDYATPYGTRIRMADNGTVIAIDNNGGAEGRRLSVRLDDGRRIDYIHLSKNYMTRVGQRVGRGTYVAESGASGFGKDRYYGPHVHVSLWERPGMSYRDTIDFQRYIGGTPVSGGGGALTYADIQRGLNKFGYNLAVDNNWGPKSSNALADFQRRNGLTIDRIVGPKTRAALGI